MQIKYVNFEVFTVENRAEENFFEVEKVALFAKERRKKINF